MNRPNFSPGPWAALKYPDVKSWTVAGKTSVASKLKSEIDARLISASPDAYDILTLLRRFIQEGSSQISFGALLDTDDETTLKEAVERYFKKVEGSNE